MIIKEHYTYRYINLKDQDMEFKFTDPGGTLHTYFGSIFSTGREILKKLDLKGEIALIRGKKLYFLKEHDLPLLKCIYYKSPHIKTLSDYRFLILNPLTTSKTPFPDFSNIKKLVLNNVLISKIDLRDFPLLDYVDVSKNYLTVIKLDKKVNHCNVSHNNLQNIDFLEADYLIANNNRIGVFETKFYFYWLDLSYNPLHTFKGKVRDVILSNTKLKILSCKHIFRLTIESVMGIKLIKTKYLEYLNIGNCGLRELNLTFRNLMILNIRNNGINSLPYISNLRILHASSNFFMPKFVNTQLWYLDIAKNSFIYFEFDCFPELVSCINSHNLQIFSVSNKCRYLRRIWFYDDVPMLEKIHRCMKTNEKVVRVLLKNLFGFYRRLFILFQGNWNIDIKELVLEAIKRIKPREVSYEFISEIKNTLISVLYENGLNKVKFCIVMILDKSVIIVNRDMNINFCNYVRVNKLKDDGRIYAFDNIGTWALVPLFCKQYVITTRYDLYEFKDSTLYDLLSFLEVDCPLTYRLSIYNTPTFYSKKVSVPHTLISTNEMSAKDAKFPFKLFKMHAHKKKFSDKILRNDTYYDNELDPNFDVDAAKKVFLFIKYKCFTFRDIDIFLIKNIHNIMKFLSGVFKGDVLEFHDSDSAIVRFFRKVDAAMFGVYFERRISQLGVNVSIGMSCGPILIKNTMSPQYYIGPALNFSARASTLGKQGLFCCRCNLLTYKKLRYEFLGNKLFKGYSFPHPMYKVYMKWDDLL